MSTLAISNIIGREYQSLAVTYIALNFATTKIFNDPILFLSLLYIACLLYIRVLSESHKKYFKDWCLMNSQPNFPSLTYLKLINYGHIIKSM